ncbi:p-nitrophenylphosphatase [Leishmania donovani]|uniref:p-nitrophenylphosphatase_-_putative n=3 Tax=Leishmania donovani species complex TaxID=38574 RepID=A0A6L0XX98_LEIIN|nr:putative p-nitrophenylphosphatase [Leishmania infantum JPCM5]TPP41382.1 HAD hydrolase, IIA family protein [Leishmania donovani]CAC9520717.1 p-nitrophenylphosphatase_-_putative [Leishmania infantum]CAJ1991439.1 p-nitrophenylphosphatase [Leishmania donovani]CAM70619.1 putative p-nitrophenylphosphatase [Leishmania infantum JPCM5]SUZ44469.1 p-nitrophenylphosphatase_-_putative [Leishmania infantum]|eukprot:XP_001467559.1 putative p-nitrophenylphosphatase [Leishmania infantum JPCM5]
MASSIANPAELKELLDSIDYILVDLDGVVWSGEKVISRIPEALDHIRSFGKSLRFISNTLILQRCDLVKKFESLGIRGVLPHEIYSAAYASALYIQEKFSSPEDRLVHANVFVMGPIGLHNEVQSVLAPDYSTYGSELHSVVYSPDLVAEAWTEPILPAPRYAGCKQKISLQDLNPVAVVIGVDYAMNMTELAAAVALLQGTEALFVATNPDPADPVGANRFLLPSSGAILAAVTTATGRQPDVLCGKPSSTMGHLLIEKEAQDGKVVVLHRALMVGDRLMTDIQFGKGIGARTALVLSGAEKLTRVEELAGEGRTQELPDLVLNSLADFLAVPVSTA